MTFADCALEHIFDIEVLFGADRMVFGPLPGGGRQGYTPPIGGTISGPRLTGSVVPHSGADYALVRDDGVIELNAHYLLRADDGTFIYIRNKGYIIPGEGAAANAQGLPQPAYFRLTPYFRVPEGPHDWLARPASSAAANAGASGPSVSYYAPSEAGSAGSQSREGRASRNRARDEEDGDRHHQRLLHAGRRGLAQARRCRVRAGGGSRRQAAT